LAEIERRLGLGQPPVEAFSMMARYAKRIAGCFHNYPIINFGRPKVQRLRQLRGPYLLTPFQMKTLLETMRD
jgi:hypothetical protein